MLLLTDAREIAEWQAFDRLRAKDEGAAAQRKQQALSKENLYRELEQRALSGVGRRMRARRLGRRRRR